MLRRSSLIFANNMLWRADTHILFFLVFLPPLDSLTENNSLIEHNHSSKTISDQSQGVVWSMNHGLPCDWVSQGAHGYHTPFLVATQFKHPSITDIHPSRKWNSYTRQGLRLHLSSSNNTTLIPLDVSQWYTLYDLIVLPLSLYLPRRT